MLKTSAASLILSTEPTTPLELQLSRFDCPISGIFVYFCLFQALLRAGFPPELVAKLTGHKDLKSLDSYDPGMSELQKVDMEVAIAMQGPIMRGEKVELPGELLKSRAAKSQSKFHEPANMIDNGFVFLKLLSFKFL